MEIQEARQHRINERNNVLKDPLLAALIGAVCSVAGYCFMAYLHGAKVDRQEVQVRMIMGAATSVLMSKFWNYLHQR